MGVASDVINTVLSCDVGNICSKDNDIKFVIQRTDDYLPDVAFVNVYNLKQNIFSSVLMENSSNIFSVFVGITEAYPLLLFRGVLLPSSTNINLKNTKCEYGYAPDICSSFTLIEAFDFYSRFIEITYTGIVSAFTIIKDCALKTGLEDVIFSDNVLDVTYQSYKAVGKASVIVKQICKTLDTTFYIKNNKLFVGSNRNISLFMPILSSDNSTDPIYVGYNSYKLITIYNSDIKPGSILEVFFPGLLVGTFIVHQTLLNVDTAKNFIEMSVIIGI